MRKILITGGAGFIGCNTAEYYLKRGEEVTVLDNLSRSGAVDNLLWLKGNYPQLKFVQGDIRGEPEKLNRAVRDKDLVFHLAAQTALAAAVTNPREDFTTNALGTLNVLEAVREVSPEAIFLYSSTNKVYGEINYFEHQERNGRYEFVSLPEGISEFMPLDYYSPYGCSKGAGDQYVRDYARTYGLKTIVFRLSCVYGPRQVGSDEQAWLANFTRAALMAEPLTIYGDGKQVSDVLYITDLIQAFDLALANIKETSGQIYNIGGGPANTLSPLELVGFLETRLKGKIKHHFSSWNPGEWRVYISNINKATEAFGWVPETDPESGVEKLYNWVKENQEALWNKS